MTEPNGVHYRLGRLEDDVKGLQQELRDYGAMRERVANLSRDVRDLSTEVAGLRRALIGSALGVTASAVIFAVTILQVL